MIETEHNGYKIRYGENSDTWECYDLQLSANTLSALKDKINKTLAQERRLGNIAVLKIGHGWHAGADPGVLTALCAEGTAYHKAPAGWVVFTDKKGRKKREKVALGELVLDTPEHRKAMAAYIAERRRIRALEEAADETVKALPRLTPDELKEMKTND